MANLLDWIFPCFIGRAGNRREGTRQGKKALPEANPFKGRPVFNSAVYHTNAPRSMVYLGLPPKLKATKTDNHAEDPGQGTVAAESSDTAYEMQPIKQSGAPTPLTHKKARLGRPDLTVRIPSSNSKPPVEKFHLSPDSGFDNHRAFRMAASIDSSAGHHQPPWRSPTGPRSGTAIEKPTLAARSNVASGQTSAETNPFETPPYTKWRNAQKGTLTPDKGNLRDELDCFSIASQEEDLSEYAEKASVKSPEAVSSLRSIELNSSIHDFAKEEHRDFAARLSAGCLDLAHHLVEKGKAGIEEAKQEVKQDGSRKLC